MERVHGTEVSEGAAAQVRWRFGVIIGAWRCSPIRVGWPGWAVRSVWPGGQLENIGAKTFALCEKEAF
jgi:hypothetical protein